MAATVEVEVWTGGSDGSPSKANDDTLRFRTDDSPGTRDATNPCVIPSSGTNYSYWVHVALALSGTYTQIDNVRHYSDGDISWTLGTGGGVVRGNRDTGDHGVASDSYEKVHGTEGTSGSAIESEYTFYSGQTTKTANVTSDTSGSPATIDSTTHGPNAEESTKAVVLQAVIADDATQGTQAAETFTFVYDEI
jgi:hypothetical protein